jgi:ATPase subunit of ABC transporter with duplicated ATPase domains
LKAIERNRRKARQKLLREEMEEKERQRALKEAMDVLNQQDQEETPEELIMKHSQDNAADIHLRNFDLPNLRGGGPDLLQNSSLTLSKGRRYGLMGRNGCGKTMLMTYIANRQIPGLAIPKTMTMLLVRQEIIGNDWTAVETVLKSDVKRERVKRFIAWCEEELDRLEMDGKEETSSDGKKVSSKGREKIQERKKRTMQMAARASGTARMH